MSLGYVVIEWNQASQCPKLYDDEILDTLDEAIELKRHGIQTAKARGRRETYGIARVTLDEPYESWER
jgi:hypothetical protein